MATVTLRSVKGSPLTVSEMDTNFTNLNNDKLETTSYTASDVLTKIKTVDGSGSGLDADLLDGLNPSSSNTASTIVSRDSSGNFSAGTITASFTGDITGDVTGDLVGNVTGDVTGNVTGSSGSCTGNSLTANSLTTPRDIGVTLSGDVAGTATASFDGSANVTVTVSTTATINNTHWSGTDLGISNGGTGASTSAGARTNLGLGTTDDVQFDSFGVGTAASGTTGEIRATNNITAYYSSDERLKENVKPIENAVDLLNQISGVRYEWTDDYINSKGGEDGVFVRKQDIGVIAQEIEKVLPEIVAENSEGYKAVRYERIVPLLIQAIKELSDTIQSMK